MTTAAQPNDAIDQNPNLEINATEKTFNRLRIFNAIMGVLHLIQSIVMVVLSSDFAIPMTTQFLEFDEDAPAGEQVMPNLLEQFDVTMAPLIALFLFLSAIAHFLIAGPFFERYEQGLKEGRNFFRWYEYALSSSVMIVALALFTGISDIFFLLTLFTLNASMNLFGLLMESMNRYTPEIDWTPFTFGCIAGIVPWIAIGGFFFGALGNADATIPNWVIPAFITLFLFFNSFAINMFLQYKKIGPWSNYIFGEYGYVVLSLVAKSALAWQIYAGTLANEGGNGEAASETTRLFLQMLM
jgi:hypothetical protein